MSRRGLVVALIVSLAVNLFVLGGLVGMGLMGFLRPHGPPQLPGPPRLAAVGAALDPARREAWDNTVRQSAQIAGPKLHQARDLRRQAWANLSKDPVDPQAALAALDQSRTLEFQARAEMDRSVVGFAATLPANERRSLGEALSRARPHAPHGGPWSGDHSGGGPVGGPGGGPGLGDPPPPVPDR